MPLSTNPLFVSKYTPEEACGSARGNTDQSFGFHDTAMNAEWFQVNPLGEKEVFDGTLHLYGAQENFKQAVCQTLFGMPDTDRCETRDWSSSFAPVESDVVKLACIQHPLSRLIAELGEALEETFGEFSNLSGIHDQALGFLRDQQDLNTYVYNFAGVSLEDEDAMSGIRSVEPPYGDVFQIFDGVIVGELFSVSMVSIAEQHGFKRLFPVDCPPLFMEEESFLLFSLTPEDMEMVLRKLRKDAALYGHLVASQRENALTNTANAQSDHYHFQVAHQVRNYGRNRLQRAYKEIARVQDKLNYLLQKFQIGL